MATSITLMRSVLVEKLGNYFDTLIVPRVRVSTLDILIVAELTHSWPPNTSLSLHVKADAAATESLRCWPSTSITLASPF